MKKKCRCCHGSGEEMDHKRLGANLTRLREANDISQVEMARRMGISSAYLSQLESGLRKWRLDLVSDFEQALGPQE